MAFNTNKINPDGTALLLLGGVKKGRQGMGLAPISTFNERNALIDERVKKVVTHFSARNYGIMNTEMRGFGYRVTQTFIVRRKYYPR